MDLSLLASLWYLMLLDPLQFLVFIDIHLK